MENVDREEIDDKKGFGGDKKVDAQTLFQFNYFKSS